MRVEHWRSTLPRWLGALVRRGDAERDLDDELRDHIEQQTTANIADGMTPAAARRAALVAFGGVERIKDESRDARRLSVVDAGVQDLRYSLHVLRSNPGFTLAVALTLAFGIGATAAMFGVVDRLLLRPPSHITAASQLRRLYAVVPGSRAGHGGAPGVDRIMDRFPYVFYSMLRADHPFPGIAAYGERSMIVGRGAGSRRIDGTAATADLFPLLGVTARIGRLFTPAEDDPRAPTNVVVLSHEFWQREYGASPSVLGQTLSFDDTPFTIIGVLPPGFTGAGLRQSDFWIPMSSGHDVSSNWATTWRESGSNVVVRLNPAIDPDAASREATRALANSDANGFWKGNRLTTRPISSDRFGNAPPVYAVARWLTAVAAIVLLIACANVANLLLARALGRRREIAVRLALGISVSRLLRLLVTESMTLAVLGGAGGVMLAFAGGELVRRRFLPDVVWDASPVNGRVLMVALLLTVAAGVFTSIFPVVHARRTDVMSALKSGARGNSVLQGRVRTSLLVAQSALAVALMIAAGLFIRSLMNIRGLDLAFEPQRVLSADIWWTDGGDSIRHAAQLEVARAHLASIPEYEHAALAIGSPFGGYWRFGLKVPGRDSMPTLAGPWVNIVSPDYFATVGTPLVRGRLFTAGEGAGTEPVTIVDETMARALWPGESALGHCLLIGGGESVPCSRVVGVVRDARRSALREDPQMQYYVPLGQGHSPISMVDITELLIRPRGDAMRNVAALRTIVMHDMPDARYVSIGSMQDRIDPLIRPWRLGAELFGLFGALALIVAGTGLYSVVAYITAQRTHEFGVRIALGAGRAHLFGAVISRTALAAMCGAMLGVALPLVATRWLDPLLFDESTRDPAVIGIVAGLVVVVTLLASLAPAKRAMRVDPLVALRSD